VFYAGLLRIGFQVICAERLFNSAALFSKLFYMGSNFSAASNYSKHTIKRLWQGLRWQTDTHSCLPAQYRFAGSYLSTVAS
jgi:hypothetical protein